MRGVSEERVEELLIALEYYCLKMVANPTRGDHVKVQRMAASPLIREYFDDDDGDRLVARQVRAAADDAPWLDPIARKAYRIDRQTLAEQNT